MSTMFNCHVSAIVQIRQTLAPDRAFYVFHVFCCHQFLLCALKKRVKQAGCNQQLYHKMLPNPTH